MIQVELSIDEFAYDVRSLVQAFYPDKKLEFIGNGASQVNSKNDTIIDKRILIIYTTSSISISIFKNEIPILLETVEIIGDALDTCSIENYQDKINLTTSQRKRYKNQLKRLLYSMLSKVTNQTLSWGTLTGIRPTKIPMKMLEDGLHISKIKQYMLEEYVCSKDKVDLCVNIARKEYDILQDMDYKNGYSLYIGIPFCPTTCLYCSFTSYSIEKYADQVEAYLEALFKEIDEISLQVHGKKLITVYLGGGTPTTLSANQLERLLIKIKSRFSMEYVRELTVEAGRPDSINREKLQVLKELGVTRISINPQTMRQKTLDVIGRRHTVEQIIEAFHMAREVGHDNINMDLILGLPGENCMDVRYTLDEINKLNPDSLTIHTLALKRAARLNTYKELYCDMAPTDTIKMLTLSREYAKTAGYNPYYLYRQKNMTDNLENIGYSKIGKEGIYNILIMEEKHTIIALGAGASSKFVFENGELIKRSENVKSVKDYIERVNEMIDRKHLLIERNFS